MWSVIRRTLLASALVLSAAGCTDDSDTPDKSTSATTPAVPSSSTIRNENQIRIATWNVHNLFNTKCDSLSCDVVSYEPILSEKQYQKKVKDVAAGIKYIDVDIIMLQEIETEECFEDVRETLGVSTWPSGAFGEIGRAASIDVGILTRGKIDDVQTYRADTSFQDVDGNTWQLARELLQAEITLPNGKELTVFTTHFISKLSDPEGIRRIGEATLTQQILADYLEKHPGRLVVFGGDLNDFPDSDPIQTLQKDDLLISVHKGKEPMEIRTWSNSSTLDYLFYPPEFEDRLISSQIFCDGGGYSTSDHCPVRAIFEFK